MPSPPGFFHLPITIRHRIYDAAGLPIRTDVAMSREERARRGEKGFSAPDLRVFTCLILVCRAMHNEVVHLFYSGNRFYIRHHAAVGDVGGRDLAPLRQLSPRALSALSFLTVRLHISGKRSHSFWELDTLKCPESEDEPLISSTPQAEATLLEWQATVQRLSSHVSPAALHLGLVCDVADSEMARRITFELDHLPALRQCDIRLNNDPNKEELFAIAKQAAVRALQSKTTRPFPISPPSPFRFLDLPPEVRLHILGYTELITPLSAVSWENGLMHDIRRRRLTGSCENDFEWMDGPPHTECKPPYDGCYPRDHEGCDPHTCLREPRCPHQFKRCWRCPHYGCQFLKCWSRSAGGCFCRALHTAYSTECRCWRPPTDLFLVSRRFCNDARAVFYSRNHFIVESVSWDHRLPRPPRHPASIFLRDAVPTGALSYLRSLEICGLHFDRYPLGDDAADQDWLRTVDYLKDKISPVFFKIAVSTSFPVDETKWPDMNFYRALEVDGDIDLLRNSIAAFWPLDNLGLNSLQQLYAVVRHDGELGYYFRRRGQAPLATAPTMGSFNHERAFRLLGTDDHGARNLEKGKWVEGIWGYIWEY